MASSTASVSSAAKSWLCALGLLTLAPLASRAQTGSVGIGTTTPNASAALDVSSTSKGLLLPRLTKTQRDAIPSPAAGLLIYQTDNSPGVYQFNGTAWVASAADNLGNHTATQNLQLGANQLVGNGGTQGLSIGSGGQVGVGTSSPTARLQVNTNTGAEAMVVETPSSNQRYSNGNSHWQSFTAVHTGQLSKIALHATGPWGSSTLTIRAGEGAGGTVLFTGTNNFTSNGWFETVVNVPVMAGSKYTIVLSNANGWSGTPDNYAGGRSDDPNLDLSLRVWQQGYSTPTLAVQDDGVVKAAQLSLGGGATAVTGISADGTLAGNSNASLPTEQAVKTYVDAQVAAVPGPDNLGNHTATQDLNLNGQLLTGGGAAGLAVTAAGNVGVGTAAPSQKLQVAGQVYSSSGGFRFPDNSVQTTAASAQQLSKAGSTISLSGGGGSVTDSDNQTLTLSARNLSISGGNTVALPAAQVLSISGSTISLGGGGGSVTVPSSADNLGNHTATQTLSLNGNWLSNDGGAEGISIDNSGRVGIGTAGPVAALELASGELRLPGGGGVNRTHFNYQNPGQGNDGYNYIRGTTILADLGGSVGVGTAAPTSRLHVSGSISMGYGAPAAIANSQVTLTEDDYTIRFPGTVSGMRVNLPEPSTCYGRVYNLLNGPNNAVEIRVNGTVRNSGPGSVFDVVSNSVRTSIPTTFGMTIQSDGTNWIVISRINN
jgi:hypothetical protein